MIAKLTGIIDQIYDNSLILNVSGVGYLVYCPKNIITVHLMYKNIINGCSPESECTSDFGKSRVIFFNKQ